MYVIHLNINTPSVNFKILGLNKINGDIRFRCYLTITIYNLLSKLNGLKMKYLELPVFHLSWNFNFVHDNSGGCLYQRNYGNFSAICFKWCLKYFESMSYSHLNSILTFSTMRNIIWMP